MFVLSSTPSGRTTELSLYTGRSRPPLSKLPDISNPLNNGLTLR